MKRYLSNDPAAAAACAPAFLAVSPYPARGTGDEASSSTGPTPT